MSALVPASALLYLPAGILRRWHGSADSAKALKYLVQRRMMILLAKVDRLKDEVTPEVEAELGDLEKIVIRRMPSLERESKESMAAWWKRTIGEYADRLKGRQEKLTTKVVSLAQAMVDVAPDSLGEEVEPAKSFTPDDPWSPKRAYDGILHRWDKPIRDQLGNIMEDVRRGDIGQAEATFRVIDNLGVTGNDARRVMRTGIGSAHAQASEQRLQEVGERLDGLGKKWWSALTSTTRPWHAKAHGQTVPIDEPFRIESSPWERKHGYGRIIEMRHPLDPEAPAGQVVFCLCCELADIVNVTLREELLAA